MAHKIDSASGSITLISEDGSGNVNLTLPRAGLGTAASADTGTASGNIPVLDGSGQIASGVLSNAAVADNAITLAKMAHGTDGELITYDATGAPANVAVGTSGQVLTSGGTGVAPTFQTAAGGGKVLQVVSFTSSTQGSTSITTSDTASNPVIQDTITPLGNSSKFLIQVRWFGEVGDAWGCVAHIHRGSSRINEANTNNYHGLSMPTQSHPAGENNDSTPEILTLSTLDTTGSTTGTSITFKLMFSHQSTRTMWTNRCFGTGASSETGVSEMIITEIGA